MSAKEMIRSKLYEANLPSPRSFESFIHWAAGIDRQLLQRSLDEIQNDLDAEEHHFSIMSEFLGKSLSLHKLCQKRRDYCAELRAYYHYQLNCDSDYRIINKKKLHNPGIH